MNSGYDSGTKSRDRNEGDHIRRPRSRHNSADSKAIYLETCGNFNAYLKSKRERASTSGELQSQISGAKGNTQKTSTEVDHEMKQLMETTQILQSLTASEQLLESHKEGSDLKDRTVRHIENLRKRLSRPSKWGIQLLRAPVRIVCSYPKSPW